MTTTAMPPAETRLSSAIFRRTATTRRSAAVRNALLSGAAARIASTLLTLISLPLALRYLGTERYGVWVTISTAAIWINLLDLGIANTLTTRLSRAFAHQDDSAAASALSNAIFLTASMSGIAACLCCVLASRVNWMRLLRLSSSVIAHEAQTTALAAALLTLLALPANVIVKLLAARQQQHITNFLSIAAALCSVAGLVCGILLHASMALLFVVAPGCLMMANIALATWIVLSAAPSLRPRVRLLHWPTMLGLCNSGFAFLAIQISSVIVLSSDNLVVSHYLGAAEVTPYSVAWRLAALGTILPSLLFPALWPAYAEAYAKSDLQWVRRAFNSAIKATLVVSVPFAIMLVAAGQSIIRYWVGGPAVPSRPLLIAMAFWTVLSGLMTAESCLLAAAHRVRNQAVLSIVAAALNLALSIFLVQHIGSLGVILGTISSYVLVLVVPQTRMVLDVLQYRVEEAPTPSLSAVIEQP